MTDYRTPEDSTRTNAIPEDELVPADDTIIGKAFLWSVVVFALIGASVGGMIWMLNRPMEEAPTVTPTYVPPQVLQAPDVTPPSLPIVDITKDAGIDFVRENGATGEKLLPETMGGGCAFFDFDNDGDQDILLINGTHWPHNTTAGAPTHALYRNDGTGSFENVTVGSGLDSNSYGVGVAIGDYDNDGDADVYITNVGRNNLFQNDNGYFRDVTSSAGVGGNDDEWGTSAGFLDYDNDGDLDLFVCNYIKWSREIDFAVDYRLTGIGRAYGPPTNFEGTYCTLYQNNGDGTFRDVSESAGIHVNNPATGQPVAKALAVCFVDADRDGWLDIFVANDTVQNFFFHNQKDGTFKETGTLFGVAFDRNGHATGAMGIDSAHYRNDDSLGFGIGNFANEMTSLYVSQGTSLQFADESISDGIGAPTRLMLTFGLFFFDADLDGRTDLLQCNGHLEEDINVVQSSQYYEQPTQLFWNAGPNQSVTFVEVPDDHVGDLSTPIVGRGAAYADIDSDGDLDVLLTQPRGRPMLLRNDQQLEHNWIRIKLRGFHANRDAIGATIELSADSRVQRKYVMPTRSYLSQVELPVTFGLGESDQIDWLRITWPNGEMKELKDVQANQQIVITQD